MSQLQFQQAPRAVETVAVAGRELWLLVASMAECLELQTIESPSCQVPGLECLLVEVRAVVDLEVVLESPNLHPPLLVGPPQGCLARGGANLCRFVPVQSLQTRVSGREFVHVRVGLWGLSCK